MEDLKPLNDNDPYIVDIATPIFNNIIDAHQTGDYEKLAVHLSEAMKQGLNRQNFDSVVKCFFTQLGGIKKTAYLGRLRKKESTHILWKVRYEKDNQELLWQLFLARSSSGVKLVGLLYS
jgi:hypothetical protein